MNIVTCMFNVSQINYMHNPNPMVYFTNPKTFTPLHSAKIVNIDCNSMFKFQTYFRDQQRIGIKDSKVTCACPRLVCCDYNYCLLLIAYCNYNKSFNPHHDNSNVTWRFGCPNTVSSLIIRSHKLQIWSQWNFMLNLKPIDFQAQFQGAESLSGVDLIPQAIQVKVRCGFSKNESLIACSSRPL